MLEEFKKGLGEIISFAKANASTLSDAVKARFVEFLKAAQQKLKDLGTPKAEPTPAPAADTIPDTARLLWVSAGGDIEAFVNFLGQYPDPSLLEIRNNPTRLIATIRQLNEQYPQGEEKVIEGVPSSALPSSNIWGFSYNDKSGNLFVKFNGKTIKDAGPLYVYNNVPKEIAQIFMKGSISAKTSGKNKWNSWFVGKSPSLGASHHALIKKGGYPYLKLT